MLDDALRDYSDRQQKERPRRHVMTAFASSLEEFDSLYRDLAKEVALLPQPRYSCASTAGD